jgi:hypothetical protein
MALVKHNNNSISAVTSMASLSTGDMTLIKEVTASSDASISFVDGSSDVVLDSTYPIYKFEFISIHPATDNSDSQFNMSSDSGSNYNVTKTSTVFEAYQNEADTQGAVGYGSSYDLAQSTSNQSLMNAVGNDNDQGSNGSLLIFNPSSTTFVKHYIYKGNHITGGNSSVNWFVAGYGNTTSAIDGIKFQMSSGNIDSGTIKLYGIKDS